MQPRGITDNDLRAQETIDHGLQAPGDKKHHHRRLRRNNQETKNNNQIISNTQIPNP